MKNSKNTHAFVQELNKHFWKILNFIQNLWHINKPSIFASQMHPPFELLLFILYFEAYEQIIVTDGDFRSVTELKTYHYTTIMMNYGKSNFTNTQAINIRYRKDWFNMQLITMNLYIAQDIFQEKILYAQGFTLPIFVCVGGMLSTRKHCISSFCMLTLY
jgi:hypothetical protein